MSVESLALNVERSGAAGAVFLSYASQDAEAAKKICTALRGAGIEVWFDQSELVGGDAWDVKIRKQIAECALFVPIVSANTQARLEGYFRLEWKLAAQRTHTMADEKTFLLPVVIDGTRDAEAKLPVEFKAVQWTRLPGGETTAKFCERVQSLLGGAVVFAGSDVGASLDGARGSPHVSGRRQATPLQDRPRPWLLPLVLGVAAIVTLTIWQPWKSAPTSDQAARRSAPLTSEISARSLSEARQLALQARALIDDDWLAVRESFRMASELCERATKLDPTDGEAWATWARVSFEMLRRKYDSSIQLREAARSQAERAIKLAPKSLEAKLAEAEGLARNARKSDAAQRLRALLGEAPKDARVARALANAVDRAEATEIRLTHPSFVARDPRPLADEGTALYHSGRLADVEELMERALALAPCYEAYDFQLAYLIYIIGDLPRARLLFEKLPPQLLQEDVFAGMAARLWLRLGDGEKALTLLRGVPRDYLEDSWIVGPKGTLTGWALRMSGRAGAADAEWKQALVVVEKRLATLPNDPTSLMAKATVLALTGQKTEAEKNWRLAAELGNFSPANRAHTRARIHAALGENEEAIRELQAGLLPVTNGDTIAKVNMVRFDPEFELIRNDPRVQQIIAAGDTRIQELRQKIPNSATVPPTKSVAVLAFANLSDDKANEYFSDGISEELLNVLAKVPGLKVSARTSAFHFKGKDTPIPEIARQLGVAYVVEGSVRKMGGRVRITAQLIKAADGFPVWSSGNLDRDVKDIFAVQDDIAGLVARNLQLKLGTPAASAMGPRPEVVGLYLQGRQLWNLRTDAALAQAEALFEQALALDPKFARARVGLADVWIQQKQIPGFADRSSPAIERIIAQARTALAQDATLAEAHATIGLALSNVWQISEGERSLRRAIELNPNYASAHQWLGRLLLSDGRMDEALGELKQAAGLDPLSPIILDNHAMALLFAGRPVEAMPLIERALVLRSDSAQTLAWKTWALMDLGRGAEALAATEQLRRLPLENGNAVMAVAYALMKSGRSREAAEFAAQVGVLDHRRFLALAGAGRSAEAVALLNAAGYTRTIVQFLLFLPGLDPVRDDPRFVAALATLGLTEAHARAQAWREAHPPEKAAR